MSEKTPPTPAQQLCAVIDAHKHSPLVMATPLARVLPVVRQVVLVQEADISELRKQVVILSSAVELLAGVLLDKHYGKAELGVRSHEMLTDLARRT